MTESQIQIDVDSCAASATCAQIAPQLFDLVADADTAVVLQSRITDPDLVELAREAERSCPTAAIRIDAAL